MLPGPDKVIECPACKALSRVFTLRSGNTLDARRWTDGKMIAPMLPIPPAITRCRNCGGYFWLSDAKEIGQIFPSQWRPETSEVPESWKATQLARDLSESESLDAISRGMARNREQELHLRIGAWWAGNDAFRSLGQGPAARIEAAPARSPEASANLARLLELLSIENPEQRLMRAEILRELGRYDEALHALQANFPSANEALAALIRDLARQRNPVVREVLD